MKKIPLAEVKDSLSEYLRQAEKEDIIITRHGTPAGLLIGFASEEDWFAYCLKHDPHFLERASAARQSMAEAQGVYLDEIEPQVLGATRPGIGGKSGLQMLQFAGSIPAEELELISQAIQAGCEQVDGDEW